MTDEDLREIETSTECELCKELVSEVKRQRRLFSALVDEIVRDTDTVWQTVYSASHLARATTLKIAQSGYGCSQTKPREAEMAYADYQHCAVCDAKTFYDAHVDWDAMHVKKLEPDHEGWGPHPDGVKSLCEECAETHVLVVQKREKGEESEP